MIDRAPFDEYICILVIYTDMYFWQVMATGFLMGLSLQFLFNGLHLGCCHTWRTLLLGGLLRGIEMMVFLSGTYYLTRQMIWTNWMGDWVTLILATTIAVAMLFMVDDLGTENRGLRCHILRGGDNIQEYIIKRPVVESNVSNDVPNDVESKILRDAPDSD